MYRIGTDPTTEQLVALLTHCFAEKTSFAQDFVTLSRSMGVQRNVYSHVVVIYTDLKSDYMWMYVLCMSHIVQCE